PVEGSHGTSYPKHADYTPTAAKCLPCAPPRRTFALRTTRNPEVPAMRSLPLLALLLAAPAVAGEKEKLFVATPFTKGIWTAGIEGPNCDKDGNVYAVNLEKEQTIGKVTPDGVASVFVSLPGKSTGNGIVFDPAGFMYVADYVGHNVLKID